MRKLTTLIALALAALLLASACGDGEEEGEEEGITVEDLTGIWSLSPNYLQFNEDGTYRFASTVADLENLPFDLGQFRLEGPLLTFTTSDESPVCAGQSGIYQVELTEEGHLQFALEEDPGCALRATGVPSLPWRRTSP